MARQKTKVPKEVAGIRIRKRQRKQLRALVQHIDKIEELLAAGTALVAMLGITEKIGRKRGKADRSDKADRPRDRPASLTH
ncbi:MAG: hypothetical protein JF595_07960 [Sphingomonadales bacterium]|nr:hypothetical protein [Sphingomonadales bacterium]